MSAADLRPVASWAAVLLVVAVGLVVLRPGGGWPAANAAEDADEAVVDGSFAVESYAQVCAECHGLTGGGGEVPGTGEPVPALLGNPDITVPYVDLVLRTGRMPPPGDPFDNRPREVFYTEAERSALVAWMAEEFDLEGQIPVVEEGDVARGLEVFARNCAHCHGNAGAGGTAGQQAWTPPVNQLDGTAIVEAIRVGPFEMPAFSPEVLSEADANGVVAYLAAVGEEAGTPLGLTELNPVFASGFVGLLALALLGSLVYIAGRPVPFEQIIRPWAEDETATDEPEEPPLTEDADEDERS